MFQWGRRSLEEISTLDPDLQKVLNKVIQVTQVDLGIAEGHRPVSEQKYLYASGRTRPGKIVTQIDGVRKKGMHNYSPSLAFDIYAYVPGRKDLTYSPLYITYLGGVITAVAADMFQKGEIRKPIVWGYNWDSDGQIGTDQDFDDMVHFQLGSTL